MHAAYSYWQCMAYCNPNKLIRLAWPPFSWSCCSVPLARTLSHSLSPRLAALSGLSHRKFSPPCQSHKCIARPCAFDPYRFFAPVYHHQMPKHPLCAHTHTHSHAGINVYTKENSKHTTHNKCQPVDCWVLDMKAQWATTTVIWLERRRITAHVRQEGAQNKRQIIEKHRPHKHSYGCVACVCVSTRYPAILLCFVFFFFFVCLVFVG